MRAPHLLPLLLLAAPMGCGGGSSAPSCAVLQAQHETQEDVVQLGDVPGLDTIEDALVWRVSAVRDAPDTGLRLGYIVDCIPQDCAARMECGPDDLNAGEDVRCDLFTEATQDCDFECEVTVAVDYGNEDVCREVRTLDVVAGHQVVPIPGR